MKLKHLLIAVVVFATMHVKAAEFNVSGTWEGGDGHYVVILLKDNTPVDSVLVVNGKFHLTGPIDRIKEAVIRAGTGGGGAQFLLEAEPVFVVCGFSQREGREPRPIVKSVTGSRNQTIYKTYTDTKTAEAVMMFGLLFAGEDRRDTVTQLYLRAQERSQRTFDSLVTNNPDEMASAIIIIDQGNDWGLEKTETMYNKLTPRVQQSELGRRVKSMIDLMRSLTTGALAPDFTMKDKNGNQVSISDFRGKYLILDFWGSWCGPCIRTHPKLVETYNKYRSKNFEILGLASERATDNVAWLAAIEKGGLEWPQVNLKTNPNGQDVLAGFNVRNFPTKILIDPNGVILGTWIGRLDGMYDMLQEIFGM